jgi:hypothetical protein
MQPQWVVTPGNKETNIGIYRIKNSVGGRLMSVYLLFFARNVLLNRSLIVKQKSIA